MTVKELILKLLDCDQNSNVLFTYCVGLKSGSSIMYGTCDTDKFTIIKNPEKDYIELRMR